MYLENGDQIPNKQTEMGTLRWFLVMKNRLELKSIDVVGFVEFSLSPLKYFFQTIVFSYLDKGSTTIDETTPTIVCYWYN